MVLVIGDAVAVTAGLTLPLVLLARPAVTVVSVGAGTAVGLVVATRAGLYRSAVCHARTLETAGLLKVSVAASGTALFLSDAASATMSVGLVALVVLAVQAALWLVRACYEAWLRSLRRRGRHRRPVAIVGSTTEVARLERLLTTAPHVEVAVVGTVDSSSLHQTVRTNEAVQAAVSTLASSGATGVMIARGIDPGSVNLLVRGLLSAGLHVELCSELEGIGAGRVLVHELNHDPFLYVRPPAVRRWQLGCKRALDVGIAVTLLGVALPVLAVAALAIKLRDGGPVLYRQQRVGLAERRFTVYKLRTMVQDADSLLDEVAHRNERRGGPLFTCADDPRVTTVGRWLRATSVDELPQLWNVVVGTMSLVGPRPPLPAEAAQFDDELRRRFAVRPGVSGLWQVEARHNPDFWAYRRLDLYYVENWSLKLDAVIALATARAVLDGALRCLRPAETAVSDT